MSEQDDDPFVWRVGLTDLNTSSTQTFDLNAPAPVWPEEDEAEDGGPSEWVN